MAAKKKASPPATPPPQEIPLGPDHPLVLTALREDNPRDFLAALGLLRLVDLLWPQHQPALFWNTGGNPVLHVTSQLPQIWATDTWQYLVSLAQSPVSPFRHGKIEMLECAELRKILGSQEEMTSLQARFYPSLSAQINYEKGGRRSHLIIESANRSVLNGARDLLWDDTYRPDLGADLIGKSTLAEVSNTPRWHPGEAQSAAYCAADPKDSKLMDRRSLNVLALLGLTFYPVVDRARQRETLGTRKRTGEDRCFSWPIHATLLGCDALSSLLHDSNLHSTQPDATSLRSIGVTTAWRSRRFTLNQNDYFSPAEPLI
jgi:hypothetical protein